MSNTEYYVKNDEKKAKKLHKRGVLATAAYLERFGYEILDRNWECPAGEIELVARDGDALVFIEVNVKTSIEAGFPAVVDKGEKRARFEKIALYWLRDNEFVDMPVRLDVVDVSVVAKDRAMLKHWVNALS